MDSTLDMMWDDDRGIAWLVDQQVRRFRKERRNDYAGPEELEAVIAENVPDWFGYAREQWQEEFDRPLSERRLAPPGKRATYIDEFIRSFDLAQAHVRRLTPVEPRTEPGRRDDGGSIDLYDRNVLVLGGREGVAAARQFAARAEAAAEERHRLAIGLQQEIYGLRARAAELQARVEKSEDAARRAEWALQRTAAARLTGEDMPLDLTRALARKSLTELRQDDRKIASAILDWLLDVAGVKEPAGVQRPVEQRP